MKKEKNVVIVIDDDVTYRNQIVKELYESGYKVIYAKDGKEGLEKIQSLEVDIILLDINLPEGRESGFEICSEIKQKSNLAEIPIVFLTLTYNPDYVRKGFEVGGVDYIVKSSGSIELLPRIKAHIRDFNNTRAIKNANEQLELANRVATTQIEEIYTELSEARKNNNEPQIVELKVKLEERTKQLEFYQETIKLLATKPININFINEFHNKVKEFNQNITIEEAKEINYYYANTPLHKKQELKDLYNEYELETNKGKKESLINRINSFIEQVILPIGYHMAGTVAFEMFKVLVEQ